MCCLKEAYSSVCCEEKGTELQTSVLTVRLRC